MESAGVLGQKSQKSVEDQQNSCNDQLAKYCILLLLCVLWLMYLLFTLLKHRHS